MLAIDIFSASFDITPLAGRQLSCCQISGFSRVSPAAATAAISHWPLLYYADFRLLDSYFSAISASWRWLIDS
jgi:hypothetical protein